LVQRTKADAETSKEAFEGATEKTAGVVTA
jgi:hypothetical protein